MRTSWLRVRVYFMIGGLPPISSSLRQTPLDPRSEFLFPNRTLGVNNPYVTSSLTRRWVCRLQLLLVLASAVILRPVSRGTSCSMVDHYGRFRRTLCNHLQDGNVSRVWKGMFLNVKDKVTISLATNHSIYLRDQILVFEKLRIWCCGTSPLLEDECVLCQKSWSVIHVHNNYNVTYIHYIYTVCSCQSLPPCREGAQNRGCETTIRKQWH
jgi:hypothetical protein